MLSSKTTRQKNSNTFFPNAVPQFSPLSAWFAAPHLTKMYLLPSCGKNVSKHAFHIYLENPSCHTQNDSWFTDPRGEGLCCFLHRAQGSEVSCRNVKIELGRNSSPNQLIVLPLVMTFRLTRKYKHMTSDSSRKAENTTELMWDCTSWWKLTFSIFVIQRKNKAIKKNKMLSWVTEPPNHQFLFILGTTPSV